MQKKSVLYSILSVSFLGIVAKVLGLLREGVVAAYFGTSAQMDVFSLLSSLMTTILTITASSMAVSYLPVFIEDDTKFGADEASKRLSNLLNQYVVFSVLFYVLLFVLSPLIPLYIGNKVVGVSDETIVLYARLLFSTIVLSGMSRIQVAALSGLRRFGWMQITTALYSIISIILTVLLGKRYGVGVLVASYIINSVIQVVILHSVLFKGDYKYSFFLSFKDERCRSIWRSFIPVFLGTETYLLGLTIDRAIGLSLGQEGVSSALNYAGLLYGLINTIIGMPIVSVFYTELSSNFVESGMQKLFSDIKKTVNEISLVLIPLAFFLSLSSLDFVTIVLKRGAFNEHSAQITAQAFILYALSSPLYAFRSLYARVFFVLKDQRAPLFSGILFIVFNLVVAILLAPRFGIIGITIGSFAAMLFSFLLLAVAIIKKHGYPYGIISPVVYKTIIASVISCSLVFLLAKFCFIQSIYLRFIVNSLLFFVSYFSLMLLFKTPEIRSVFLKFTQRIASRFF